MGVWEPRGVRKQGGVTGVRRYAELRAGGRLSQPVAPGRGPASHAHGGHCTTRQKEDSAAIPTQPALPPFWIVQGECPHPCQFVPGAGYMPVKVEALPEGTCIHAHVPVYQVGRASTAGNQQHGGEGSGWDRQQLPGVCSWVCSWAAAAEGRSNASPLPLVSATLWAMLRPAQCFLLGVLDLPVPTFSLLSCCICPCRSQLRRSTRHSAPT